MKIISLLCVATVLCLLVFVSISGINYERDKKAQDEKVLPTPMQQDEHEVNTKAKSSYAENSEAADALQKYLEKRKNSVEQPIFSEFDRKNEEAAKALKHCIAAFAKQPDNKALRVKIIKLALTLEQVPATPNEAIELKGAVKSAINNAKSESDYADVAEACKKLSLVVPWSADVYFNLAKMQEKAGQTSEAITNYYLYLMAAPQADDAVEVRELIGALKWQMERKGLLLPVQQDEHEVDDEGRPIYSEFEHENSKAAWDSLKER